MPNGPETNRGVEQAFARLARAYDAVPGDAIPEPPEGFSGLNPRPEHLSTPFGRLFDAVSAEADPAAKDSLVAHLYRVADLLGLKSIVKR